MSPGADRNMRYGRKRARRAKNLRIHVSQGVGFCSGVRRAIKLALAAAAGSPKEVYSLGPLIHNPQVVERLRQVGVEPISRLRKGGGLLVIRSHGTGPQVLAAAEKCGYRVIDATCPFVRKAQHNARRLDRAGYEVVLVGQRRHPEVKAIVASIGGRPRVVEDAAQAKRLKFGPRVGIIAQTTMPVETFAEVVGHVAGHAREVLVFNTICSETARRQERARALARQVDVLLVVGGRNSANTSWLETICRMIRPATHHIETADEIRPRWFRRGSRVGVVAGASTPRWLVESIVERLEEL